MMSTSRRLLGVDILKFGFKFDERDSLREVSVTAALLLRLYGNAPRLITQQLLAITVVGV